MNSPLAFCFYLRYLEFPSLVIFLVVPHHPQTKGFLMNDTLNLSRMRDPSFTEEVEARSGQNLSTCYQCGNCTAGCPAGLAYDLPVNQIMRGVQLGLKDEVLNSRSIWMCLSCSTCSLRCPNEIEVAGVMETLRHMAREEGRVTVPKMEKFWWSFLDTVRAFGRTYEVGTMALYMMRSLRVTTDVDLVPSALAKGKLGLRPHKIPGGAEAVTRIFRRYRERAQREGVRP